MFKKWRNLGKNLYFSNIDRVINFSIKSTKVKKMIKLISGDKKVKNIIMAIYLQNIF